MYGMTRAKYQLGAAIIDKNSLVITAIPHLLKCTQSALETKHTVSVGVCHSEEPNGERWREWRKAISMCAYVSVGAAACSLYTTPH